MLNRKSLATAAFACVLAVSGPFSGPAAALTYSEALSVSGPANTVVNGTTTTRLTITNVSSQNVVVVYSLIGCYNLAAPAPNAFCNDSSYNDLARLAPGQSVNIDVQALDSSKSFGYRHYCYNLRNADETNPPFCNV